MGDQNTGLRVWVPLLGHPEKGMVATRILKTAGSQGISVLVEALEGRHAQAAKNMLIDWACRDNRLRNALERRRTDGMNPLSGKQNGMMDEILITVGVIHRQGRPARRIVHGQTGPRIRQFQQVG